MCSSKLHSNLLQILQLVIGWFRMCAQTGSSRIFASAPARNQFPKLYQFVWVPRRQDLRDLMNLTPPRAVPSRRGGPVKTCSWQYVQNSRLIFPVCGMLVTLAPVTQPAHVAPIQVLSAPPAAKSSPPVPIGVLWPCICVILATLRPVLPMQYSPPGWVLARSLPTKPLMRRFQKYEAELGRNA